LANLSTPFFILSRAEVSNVISFAMVNYDLSVD
jgi:hypothetical protein